MAPLKGNTWPKANSHIDDFELNSWDPGVEEAAPPDIASSKRLLERPEVEPRKPDPGKPNFSCPETKTRLRSFIPIFLVAGYAAMSIFVWAATCIMTYRRLWKLPEAYGLHSEDRSRYVIDYNRSALDGQLQDVRDNINKNQNWYQGIRVLQSIIAVVTLPLTTTVLSAAAIIYAQRRAHPLSLRQLSALADESWSNAVAVCKAPWKHYNTVFLDLAVVLYVIGGLLAPLQEYFLSVDHIKVSYYMQKETYVTDIPAQFARIPAGTTESDSNLVVLITRGMLETMSFSQPQAMLWQGRGFNCTCHDALDSGNSSEVGLSPQSCRTGAALSAMSELNDPFLAQLPACYSTGLVRQFIPRINSAVSVDVVAAEEYPKSCNKQFGSFSASYNVKTGSDIAQTWLEICMPGNLTVSPWKPTRDMQIFSETVFLNITKEVVPEALNSLVRIRLETKAGYFELPNEWRQSAGDLLLKDPYGSDGACQRGCKKIIMEDNAQVWASNTPEAAVLSKNARIRQGLDPWDPKALAGVQNKGPLLTTVLALFGQGSYLETKLSNNSALWDLGSDATASSVCTQLNPLKLLGGGVSGEPSLCIMGREGDNKSLVRSTISSWILEVFAPRSFANQGPAAQTDKLTSTFTSAAFVANQAWLLHQRNKDILSIQRDIGLDILIPAISPIGKITISVLMALHLLALGTFAAYAAMASGVADKSLDAWAMMKIGVWYARNTNEDVNRPVDAVLALDTLPARVSGRRGSLP